MSNSVSKTVGDEITAPEKIIAVSRKAILSSAQVINSDLPIEGITQILTNFQNLVLGEEEKDDDNNEGLELNPAYKKVNPEEGISQLTLVVSYSMQRSGYRTIANVRIGGRAPTPYNGRQGSHIVANSLLERAIINGMKGKKIEEAIAVLETILLFKEGGEASRQIEGVKNGHTIKKGSIEKKLKLLKKRAVAKLYLRQFNFDQDLLKARVRTHAKVLRQDLNIATENIIRLSNKREYIVYMSKPSGIDNRKNGALKDALDLAYEEEDELGELHMHVARLIDIKSEQELKLKQPAKEVEFKLIAEAAYSEDC